MPPSNPTKGIKAAFDPESQTSGKIITIKYNQMRSQQSHYTIPIKNTEGDGIPATPPINYKIRIKNRGDEIMEQPGLNNDCQRDTGCL